MASKKDRFSRQVRKELGQDEPAGPAESAEEKKPQTREDMSGLVSDVRKSGQSRKDQSKPESGDADSKENQPSTVESGKAPQKAKKENTKNRKYTGSTPMARSRNVYNVSGDVRLEDYTEKAPSRDLGPILKAAGIALIVILIGFGIYRAVQFMMMPSYMLAVASEPITASNIESLAGADPALTSSNPLHIRFEWPPGSLTTDYLRIQIDRIEGGSLTEEAMLGRRPPRTANYIYFLGPMDTGRYRITVTDQSGTTLASKEIEVR